MPFDPMQPDEDRLRPPSRFKLHSVHWAIIEYGCAAALLVVGGVHGSGASGLLSMVVLSALAGVIHAAVEIAIPEYRGPVHPFFSVAMLLLPFVGSVLQRR